MIACVLKQLPPDLERACMSAHQASAVGPGDPNFLAVLNNKKWPHKKVDLGVRFLDTSDTSLKNKILAYANKWGQTANVRFRESSQGEVRIARQPGGYWSYLGTDVLSIPNGQATMNLQGFSLSTSDAEYDRVVVHEFGHTMGFPHEHERTEILELLDVEKTVAWFWQNYGWSRRTTMQQVFDPLDPTSIFASVPDIRSIMCYQFAGACTKNGQPIPGGLVLNELDGIQCGKIYPLDVAPPPPPPPPPPPGGGGQLVVNFESKTITAPDGWSFVTDAKVTDRLVVNLSDHVRFPRIRARVQRVLENYVSELRADGIEATFDGKTLTVERPPEMAERDWAGFFAALIEFLKNLFVILGPLLG